MIIRLNDIIIDKNEVLIKSGKIHWGNRGIKKLTELKVKIKARIAKNIFQNRFDFI